MMPRIFVALMLPPSEPKIARPTANYGKSTQTRARLVTGSELWQGPRRPRSVSFRSSRIASVILTYPHFDPIGSRETRAPEQLGPVERVYTFAASIRSSHAHGTHWDARFLRPGRVP